MKRMFPTAIGIVMAFFAGLAQAQETTVFINANILTIDAAFSNAQAMAITGNRIVAIGPKADVVAAAGSGASVVNLKGNTVLPGFIDAHSHPIGGGASSVFDNVGIDRFSTVEDALAHMKSATSGKGPQDWALFVNLDLATQSFAESIVTRDHLDKIAPNAPMVIWQAGGHKMTVNSKMFELMGVSNDTPDPDGAQFGRFEDGRPDGNLSGAALLFGALKVIEPYNEYDRIEGSIALVKEWNAQGLTTLGVAGVANPTDLEVLQELAAREDFPLRTRNYLQWGALALWDQAGVKPGDGDEKSRIVGWKLSADGSNQAYTGLQREPYLNTDNFGLAYMSQTDIDQAVVEGTKRGGQMAMHGNGNAAIDNIISAVQRARAAGVDVVRPRIEHCSITEDDQIVKLKELDISCSFLIAHVLYWGGAFRDTVFGEEKAVKLDRAGSFERAGVPYSLHTDYSVSVLTPLEMVEAAVTRALFTDPETVLGKDERASVEMALRAVTSVPAFQLLSEAEIGSLEIGKLADFVVLENDPMKVEPNEIADIRVLQTWMSGQRAY
jgi:predicted amidohydrolase YtcJ